MAFSYVQALVALCLTLNVSAAFNGAFVIEYHESSHLTYSNLMQKVQKSLADIDPGCVASERHQFSHTVFQGASFDLTCENEAATQTSILSILGSIDGVKKTWPVRNLASQRAVPNIEFGALEKGDVSPQILPTDLDRTSHSLSQARAEINSSVDALSTHVMTGVDKLHAEGLTGTGLRIAVIDDGFDLNTPGLSQTNIGFAYDLIDGDNDVRDNCSYHGTHVLGIVGAKGAAEVYGVTGVAPDATYDLYRIAACGPRGASTDNLMKATLEAADRGVDILSCSYGGGLAFPDDPWSVVMTRVFENGTYVSLPSGNGGPGIFSAISPAAGESVSSVGSADNPVTPYYFWWANLTARSQTSTIRFNPGLPYKFPENNNLTIWSAPGSNNATSETQECHMLPDSPNLPDDPSNTIVLLHKWDCWKYPNGTQVAITQAYNIPYSLRYSPSIDTVERGLWFYDEREDFSLKGTFLVENSVGLELLELVKTHDTVHISLPADASTANPTLEYRENNLSGSLTSNFSSWGPTLTGRSMPYFLAPGGNILSTYPAWIGGWGVIGGASMATPFAAGVAALVKKAHPDYTPFEIQAAIATTANPVKWNDGKGFTGDFLAPVFQQGGGLVDAWKAVHSTTLFNVTSLSFNDTTNRPHQLNFGIKNTGATEATYRFSHLGAGSGYILSTDKPDHFTNAEAVGVYANVSISPETVVVGPDESVTVSVTVTKEPELPEAAIRGSYFGGYVVADATESSGGVSRLHLPYTGFGAPLAVVPIVNTTSSHLAVLNYSTSTTARAEDGHSFLCSWDPTDLENPDHCEADKGTLYPAVILGFNVQTRDMTLSVADAVTGEEIYVSSRSVSPDLYNWGYTYYNGVDGNYTRLEEGEYVWRTRSLKLNANPSEKDSWEIWESERFNIRRTTNTTRV